MATDDFIDVEIDDDEPENKSGKKRIESTGEVDTSHDDDSTDTADDDEEPGGAHEESSDDDGDDEQHNDEDSDERQAIRERRRQERQDRKARTKEREEALRRELSASNVQLNEMRQRLDAIDRRNAGSELAQLANAKEEAVRVHRHFKDQIRIGAESNNGSLIADATEKMMLASKRITDLETIERNYNQNRQRPQPLDQRIMKNAKNWADSHAWYDPRGQDADSRVVLTIDQTLAEEGLNPTTSEYWQELEKRVKKYLPHRALRGTIGTKQKSVVAGSGRETSTKAGSSVFRLSAERVKALKDAGKWDDPSERAKMVKQYRDYDKNIANEEGAR